LAGSGEPRQAVATYPRRRLDNLSDGIFGVAMTLLVLEVHFPDGFNPRTDQDLTAALVDLSPKIGTYVLSFLILAIRWRELVAARTSEPEVGKAHVNWMLVNLLLVTFVPFTTLLIGRYASLAPAVWIYAANLVGMALSTWLAGRAAPSTAAGRAEETAGLLVFLGSAAVTVALSFQHTPWAPMGFSLNALAPPVERWVRARMGGGEA